tara:strand:- start:3674 stop:5068 length:1395 start_codon:yes stop_codon:yes gene_type:complete
MTSPTQAQYDKLNTNLTNYNSIINGTASETVVLDDHTVPTVSGQLATLAAFDNKGSWVTATTYILKDIVVETGVWYVCVIAHTSGTFATDVTAGDWVIFQSEVGSFLVPVTVEGTANQALLTLGTSSENLIVMGADATPDAYLYMYNNAGEANVQFRADANDSFINTAGNFGFGTATPGQKLHVVGSAKITEDILLNADATIDFNAGATTIAHSTNQLVFQNNVDGEFRHVIKNESTGTAAYATLWFDTNGANNYIRSYSSTHATLPKVLNIGSSTSNSPIHFSPGNSTSFVLGADGNVGIGSTDPVKKLDVVGDIRTSTGILFGTDTGDANRLDDYEEGTWTPTFQNAGAYVTQYGAYTKVGRLVTLDCRLSVTGLVSNTASMKISGLPFTPASNSDESQRSSGVVEGDWEGWGSFMPSVRFIVDSSTLRVEKDNGSGSSVTVLANELSSTVKLHTSLTYYTT